MWRIPLTRLSPFQNQRLFSSTFSSYPLKRSNGWGGRWKGGEGRGKVSGGRLALGGVMGGSIVLGCCLRDNQEKSLVDGLSYNIFFSSSFRFPSFPRNFPSSPDDINRWWNNLPQSKKDTLAIIFTNFFIYSLWKVPRLHLFMEKNFICGHRQIRSHRYFTLFSSSISHYSLIHLLANCHILNTFGPLVHQEYGREGFWGLFLGGAFISSLASLANQPRVGLHGSLGTSGALLSFLLALFTSPTFSHQLLCFPFLPEYSFSAINAGMALILVDVLGLLSRWRVLDHAGHLGGALVGVGYGWWRGREERERRKERRRGTGWGFGGG